MSFKSTKIIELGSCAFRQPTATSHCKYLHGYRLTAKFWFEASSLDENNWVVDFGGLKELKNILQNQFDHTTCISKADPKIMLFEQMKEHELCDLRIMDGVGIEKFAEWCHGVADEHVQRLTGKRCKCIKVEVFEHENNSAIFEKTNKTVAVDTQANNIINVNEPITVEEQVEEVIDVNKTAVLNDTKNKAKGTLWPKKEKNTWLTGETTWGF